VKADAASAGASAPAADYVCAEAHTGTQLRDAQRLLGRPETVFTTLNDLVTAVRGDGAPSRVRASQLRLTATRVRPLGASA
jgi:hypothetical protein